MIQRVFALLWFYVLLGQARGFSALPGVTVHRAPYSQSQTAPNRPRTMALVGSSVLPPMPKGSSGTSFLPPIPPSDPALPATLQGKEPASGEPRLPSYAGEEEKVPSENEKRAIAMQADGGSWYGGFAAGTFASFSALFLALRSRIWPQSSSAPPRDGVELGQSLFSTQEMLSTYETDCSPSSAGDGQKRTVTFDARRAFIKGGVGTALGLAAPALAGASYGGSFDEWLAEKNKREAQKLGLPTVINSKKSEDAEDDEEDQLAENEDEEEEEAEKTASPSAKDEYKNVKPVIDEDPFKTRLVTVLRVQESCMQEARLITTGNFKDLQRNNIKLATRMMIENNRLNDVITKASGGAVDGSQVSNANEVGKSAIEDLQTVLDYFGEIGEVKVTDLPKDKKEFILKAFANCRDKLDRFLAYMPKEKVKAARDQVVLENELNKKELPKELEILNPVFMN